VVVLVVVLLAVAVEQVDSGPQLQQQAVAVL
jgi:hypothetical protein